MGSSTMGTMGSSTMGSLQYNCSKVQVGAVQPQLVEQPEHAFACLQEASLLYYNEPRLWLRMAEEGTPRTALQQQP